MKKVVALGRPPPHNYQGSQTRLPGIRALTQPNGQVYAEQTSEKLERNLLFGEGDENETEDQGTLEELNGPFNNEGNEGESGDDHDALSGEEYEFDEDDPDDIFAKFERGELLSDNEEEGEGDENSKDDEEGGPKEYFRSKRFKRVANLTKALSRAHRASLKKNTQSKIKTNKPPPKENKEAVTVELAVKYHAWQSLGKLREASKREGNMKAFIDQLISNATFLNADEYAFLIHKSHPRIKSLFLESAIRNWHKQWIVLLTKMGMRGESYQNFHTGERFLHYTVRHSKTSKKAMTLMLNMTDDVNATDNYGQTCLHLAASMGLYDVIISLMDTESDVHAIDTFKESPLHKAVISGDIQTVRIILAWGGKKLLLGRNLARMTPVMLAAYLDHEDIFSYLVEKIQAEFPKWDWLDKSYTDSTVLHYVVLSRNSNMLKQTLNAAGPAALLSTNCYGQTPLLLADILNRKEMIGSLVPERPFIPPLRIEYVEKNDKELIHQVQRKERQLLRNMLTDNFNALGFDLDEMPALKKFTQQLEDMPDYVDEQAKLKGIDRRFKNVTVNKMKLKGLYTMSLLRKLEKEVNDPEFNSYLDLYEAQDRMLFDEDGNVKNLDDFAEPKDPRKNDMKMRKPPTPPLHRLVDVDNPAQIQPLLHPPRLARRPQTGGGFQRRQKAEAAGRTHWSEKLAYPLIRAQSAMHIRQEEALVQQRSQRDLLDHVPKLQHRVLKNEVKKRRRLNRLKMASLDARAETGELHSSDEDSIGSDNDYLSRARHSKVRAGRPKTSSDWLRHAKERINMHRERVENDPWKPLKPVIEVGVNRLH